MTFSKKIAISESWVSIVRWVLMLSVMLISIRGFAQEPPIPEIPEEGFDFDLDLPVPNLPSFDNIFNAGGDGGEGGYDGQEKLNPTWDAIGGEAMLLLENLQSLGILTAIVDFMIKYNGDLKLWYDDVIGEFDANYLLQDQFINKMYVVSPKLQELAQQLGTIATLGKCAEVLVECTHIVTDRVVLPSPAHAAAQLFLDEERNYYTDQIALLSGKTARLFRNFLATVGNPEDSDAEVLVMDEGKRLRTIMRLNQDAIGHLASVKQFRNELKANLQQRYAQEELTKESLLELLGI